MVSVGERGRHDSYLRFRRQPYQAKEHDAGVDLSPTRNEFAKVFFRCNQQGAMLVGSMQHGTVINTWIHLRDVPHSVAILAQAVNDGFIYAFVCQQVHVP